MAEAFDNIKNELITAIQVLIQQNVLDAFGHVSVRHPNNPEYYLLAKALPPNIITKDDLLEFDLDSNPVDNFDEQLYGERYIHGNIYQARPDVHAVCHHHSPAIMPFSVTGTPLQPVSQTGAAMGKHVPFWDSREEFGDTDLLVSTPDQGDSLAKKLDYAWMVIMRRHGACVVGRTIRELVLRAVFSCRDALIQTQAASIGTIEPLSSGERDIASQLREASINRCWIYWTSQLFKSRNQ